MGLPDLDFVGDVHGHAEALSALLEELGYVDDGGGHAHPSRQAVFVGDFVDRGPGQLETLGIVRAMLDRGSALAVMGNHELNAVAFATAGPDGHYRRRSPKNVADHRAFLDAVGADSPAHAEWVEFMLDLPLFLDLGDVLVVHAWWDDASVAYLSANGFVDDGGRLARSRLDETLRWRPGEEQTEAFAAVENLLKGPEVDLPDGLGFRDHGGTARTRSRVAWWHGSPRLGERLVGIDPEIAAHPALAVEVDGMPAGPGRPVIFGHYWLPGTPRLLAPDALCVDFSIAKGNVLAAYRHERGRPFRDDGFVWVPADAKPARAKTPSF